MNWYTQARERYKNDPEYLEILKEKNRENCRKAYQKRKEKKKNGSAGNSADSDPVGGGGCVSCDNNNSDKGLSERTL